MTLDEAIKDTEEVAETAEKLEFRLCAEEHEQLAKWLKELKRQREAWKKVKTEIKEHTKTYSLSSEQNYLGTVLWSKYMISFDDVIAIIDKHLQEVEE